MFIIMQLETIIITHYRIQFIVLHDFRERCGQS